MKGIAALLITPCAVADEGSLFRKDEAVRANARGIKLAFLNAVSARRSMTE